MITRRITITTLSLAIVGLIACAQLPPKIPALPATPFGLRLYVFGASAVDSQRTFAAVKKNNPSFDLVGTGGNGEVVVGLENDSPTCVPPTAMCSYRVSYRIRDNSGAVLSAKTTTIEATATKCSDLCAQALTNVAVKIVELAANELGAAEASRSPELPVDDAGAPSSRPDAGPAALPRPKKGAKGEAIARPEPTLCNAGHGPRLPSEVAEMRAAQVEVLKRLGIVDQDEYDCLRKAYLERL